MKPKLGLGIKTDYDGRPGFTLFLLELHHHFDNEDRCDFRYGVVIGFLGFLLYIGMFNEHKDMTW